MHFVRFLHAFERFLFHHSDFRERARRKGRDKTELKCFEYLKGEPFGTDRLVIFEQYIQNACTCSLAGKNSPACLGAVQRYSVRPVDGVETHPIQKIIVEYFVMSDSFHFNLSIRGIFKVGF